MSHPAIFVVVAFLIILGCVMLRGSDDTKEVVVTLDGDSILHGMGLEHSPASRLRGAGFSVIDKTAVGLLARDLRAGYQAPFAGATEQDFPCGPQPEYSKVHREGRFVVLEAGCNDLWELRPAALYEADMRALIEIVLSEKRVPVLTGVVQLGEHPWVTPEVIALRDKYNQVTRDLAQEFGLPHAEWNLEPADTIDGIHRTQTASDRLAQRLIHAIST